LVDQVGTAGTFFRFVANHPEYDIDDLLIAGLAVGVASLTFSIRRWRDLRREISTRQSTEEKARRGATLLHDALNSISECLVIYDAEDRLVLYNDAYRRLYPQGVAFMQPGLDFDDILRRRIASGEFPDAVGHEAAYFAERVRQHREAAGEYERRLPDGKWALVSDRKMRDGGTAGMRVDITALKQTQLALRESEARLDRAQEIAAIGSWEFDLATERSVWSKQMYRLRGLSPETFDPIGPAVGPDVHPDDEPLVRQYRGDLKAGIRREPIEARFIRPDGEVRIQRIEGCPIVDPDGEIRRLSGTMQDVTEQRQLQHQLAQARKMDAIGKLAGGLAHDLNNVLGVVVGNLELMEGLLEGNQECEEMRREALMGALHGADLNRRLLAFARRQPLSPRQIDVNELVGELAKLLKRVLGEHIELKLQLTPQLWPVAIDPGQLEAALTNLATNARDAMPRGGQLDFATRNVQVGAEQAARSPGLASGDYVLIAVSDTGVGIPSEIRGSIFEPFFTTKEPGKGSGLELSTVLGFMQQSGGHMAVCSKPSEGSTFRLYLPRSGDHRPSSDQSATLFERRVPTGAREKVLVVDDDAQMRRITVRQLGDLGYRVIESENAELAVKLLTEDNAVDLLLTDVVMPGAMDGIDLANWATKTRSGLRCLLMSGFSDLAGCEQRMKGSTLPLLSKPYRRGELANAVREVLDHQVSATR
jgi:PAS domain S-box-containing protein